MSVISRTRPLDSFQHGLAEGIQILHGANEVWSAANDIVGTLPMYFTSKSTKALKDYKLYGTSEGAGVETESGEPAGYKLPLTVTSGVYNLVDIESISLLSNGRYGITIDTPGIYTITAFANSSTYVYCRSYDANNDPISNNLPVVSSSGKITAMTLTINQGEKIYVFDPIANSTLAAAKAKFTNDYIVAVSGSTAPDHYVPHRYVDTYPLYIGSTKLGAEEYLDYAEQKVYKRTEQLFNKDAKDTNNGFVAGARISGDTGNIVNNASCNITEYISVLANAEYKSKVLRGSISTDGIGFYTSSKQYLSGFVIGQSSSVQTFTTPQDCAYLRITYRIDEANSGMLVLSTHSTSSYIPYLKPTDPPASLPEITAYEGENVLTSTETVGEVTLTGRLAKTYRQVEYLESTGTQYIETNIVPTYDDAVETYLQFTAPRKYPAKQGVLGTIYDNRRYAIVLGLTEENPLPVCFYCGYPWQSPDTNIQITASVATLTQKQRYYISTTKFQLGTESKTPPSVSQSPPQKTFLLFGMWDNDGVAYPFAGFETMRCFGLTFSVAGVITHNLIPVERNSDGVLGMLDTVTNTFYTNSGTGTFNKGSYVD